MLEAPKKRWENSKAFNVTILGAPPQNSIQEGHRVVASKWADVITGLSAVSRAFELSERILPILPVKKPEGAVYSDQFASPARTEGAEGAY